MTIICYQVLRSGQFCFQYQLINFVWLSFDFFSLNWSLNICFFFYSCVCSCPNIKQMSFINNYPRFSTPFAINLFICTTRKREQTIRNNNRTVHVNEQNHSKRKTKSRHVVWFNPKTMVSLKNDFTVWRQKENFLFLSIIY